MNGLEAISHYNGWAQAFAGALIVMTGLGILSFVISQLHKIIGFIDKLGKKPPVSTDADTFDTPLPDLKQTDCDGLGVLCRPFVEKMGARFELNELYASFRKCDLPHPHLTIKALRESGKLIPLGDGFFSWNG